uniref:Peptidase_S8 domain-containing protein n=1 Tax=Panagrellus redivivus TaxID=6233 RepID=A0A7E4V7C8_PANRE
MQPVQKSADLHDPSRSSVRRVLPETPYAVPSGISLIPPTHVGLIGLFSSAFANGLSAPLDSKFVAKCLAETSNTAPGPDRIRYTHCWKAVPNCTVIAAIFNATHHLKHYPTSWKESVTILIHKKGPSTMSATYCTLLCVLSGNFNT